MESGSLTHFRVFKGPICFSELTCLTMSSKVYYSSLNVFFIFKLIIAQVTSALISAFARFIVLKSSSDMARITWSVISWPKLLPNALYFIIYSTLVPEIDIRGSSLAIITKSSFLGTTTKSSSSEYDIISTLLLSDNDGLL